MFMIKELKKIVKGINQKHIDDDISVEIISGYGGILCGTCKVSEVLKLVESEEREKLEGRRTELLDTHRQKKATRKEGCYDSQN